MPWFLCSVSNQTCLKHDQPGIPQNPPCQATVVVFHGFLQNVRQTLHVLDLVIDSCQPPHAWTLRGAFVWVKVGQCNHGSRWSIINAYHDFPVVETSNKPMLPVLYPASRKNQPEVDRCDLLAKTAASASQNIFFKEKPTTRTYQNQKVSEKSMVLSPLGVNSLRVLAITVGDAGGLQGSLRVCAPDWPSSQVEQLAWRRTMWL